jgi:Spy/CpxP family protein refolding chaperone
MTRKTKSTWIAALVTAALATAAAGSAGAFGRRGGPPELGRLEHRIERLDLSADVRAKAYAIVDGQRAKDRALREQVRSAHEELRAMLESGSPETAKLDRQIDALGALRIQQHKQFLHTMLQIGALLPEDQRAQWMAPPQRGGHGGRGGRGGHRPH